MIVPAGNPKMATMPEKPLGRPRAIVTRLISFCLLLLLSGRWKILAGFGEIQQEMDKALKAMEGMGWISNAAFATGLFVPISVGLSFALIYFGRKYLYKKMWSSGR